jgi:hypothetical protein
MTKLQKLFYTYKCINIVHPKHACACSKLSLHFPKIGFQEQLPKYCYLFVVDYMHVLTDGAEKY